MKIEVISHVVYYSVFPGASDVADATANTPVKCVTLLLCTLDINGRHMWTDAVY
jgi:hypothetical protein